MSVPELSPREMNVGEVYVRWYAQWGSNAVWGQHKHMNVTNDDGDIAFVNVQLNCGGGSSVTSAPVTLQVLHSPGISPDGTACLSPNVGPALNITGGRWYFFELHVRVGSSNNALIEGWQNDCGPTASFNCGAAPTRRWNYPNINLPGNANGSQIQTLWVENWCSAVPACSGDGARWDMIKVATAGPIGFSGASGPSNTSLRPATGATALSGTIAGRVLGSVLAPRPAIRGFLIVVVLATPVLIIVAFYALRRTRSRR